MLADALEVLLGADEQGTSYLDGSAMLRCSGLNPFGNVRMIFFFTLSEIIFSREEPS